VSCKVHGLSVPGGHCREDSDGATIRQIREDVDVADLVTQPMRGAPVKGSISQLFGGIEAVGGDGSKLPHLAGARAFSAAAQAIEKPGVQGKECA
jgi:hypothetical protein